MAERKHLKKLIRVYVGNRWKNFPYFPPHYYTRHCPIIRFNIPYKCWNRTSHLAALASISFFAATISEISFCRGGILCRNYLWRAYTQVRHYIPLKLTKALLKTACFSWEKNRVFVRQSTIGPNIGYILIFYMVVDARLFESNSCTILIEYSNSKLSLRLLTFRKNRQKCLLF